MRHCLKILTLALALAAPAQDLPQWIILLARVKSHLRQELARLTDCVCLETVRRDYRPAGGRMRPQDTVRLEVLSTGRREMFASPGDRKFTESHPAQFSAGGVIGDGMFALFLTDIATEHGQSFEYRGFEDLDGRRLARFDYRVPLMISGHSISVGGVSATVGTTGSFWADEKSFDVLRLEVHATDIPPSLPIQDSVTTVDYARVRLGERDMLLPVGGDYWQSKFSGEESHNRIEFTHCRLFAAESSIRFGAEDPAASVVKTEVVARDSEIARELPAALLVTTRLSSALTNEMAVGEMLEGVVAGKVSYRGSVLIEDGAKVHGRIRRMERHSDGRDYFIVAVEFTDIESADGRYRFYADMQDLDRPEGVEWTLRKTTANVTETTYVTDLPGVGSFFVRGSRLALPKGFRMVWRTRALKQ